MLIKSIYISLLWDFTHRNEINFFKNDYWYSEINQNATYLYTIYV